MGFVFGIIGLAVTLIVIGFGLDVLIHKMSKEDEVTKKQEENNE